MKPEALSPHTIARAEIDCWRGRCIDIFAKAERAVASALETARSTGMSARLQHLAGQRLDDLQTLVAGDDATEKQKKSLRVAIEAWCSIEGRRSVLAPGVATELLDRLGVWSVRFDLTTYKGNIGTPEHVVMTKAEAEAF